MLNSSTSIFKLQKQSVEWNDGCWTCWMSTCQQTIWRTTC